MMQSIYKILIHTKNSELIERLTILAGASYRIVPLPDINQMILAVYDEMPHLVLMDLRRANVGGFEGCRQLKGDAVLQHIPLILITDLLDGGEIPESAADRLLPREESVEKVWSQARGLIESSSHALDVHPITHMPGSRSSVDVIEGIIQKKERFALCAVHLRHLNYYYGTFGTVRGDAVVRQTMKILSEIAKDTSGGSGFVGHLGDRDFVAVIEPCRAVEFAERVIEQFELRLGGVSASAEEGKAEGVVSLSIAIITNEQKPFHHIAEVIRACEQIHRFLKRFQHSTYLKDRRTAIRDILAPASFDVGGKRPALSSDPVKPTHFNSELLMTVALAIHSGKLESYFQPIVDPRCGIFAYEALSRFSGADGKFIDPIKMFQAAREADLIKELDIACALNALRCAEKMPAKTKLFLNLNRETMLDPQSLSQLWDSGYFDTRRIVIEITEQSLVRQSSQLRSVMQELGSHGIQLALDDAGGGSVSLREAAELKPEFIKFDKSIIRDIHLSEIKRRILLSLSVFAKSMSALTVAEGVETREEWDYLQSAGIDFYQGYFIARPNSVPLASVHLPH